MTSIHPLRAAVQARDLDAIPALLAEDVTFLSPVAHAPYQGRDLVAAILRGADRAFEDFRYVREISDGPDHALVFRARIGDREVHGCDFLHEETPGQISEFTVMVRPLSAAKALAEEMARQFEIAKRELGLVA